MSRKTLIQTDRLTLVGGMDHMLGKFLQLYDKDLEHETPEGEGLVFDWSERMGIETNFTGESNKESPETIITNYFNNNN
jgi:hypothetical protein